MSLDSYLTLGRSGLRVSPLCLGAMTFGEEWGWGANPAESRKILQRYVGLGGNFVDTANIYTNGHAETIIGDFLAVGALRRDQIVLGTKFFNNLYPGDPNGGGASRKAIMAQCEQSLRRLKTDYIDLYWMHVWDSFTPIEETLRALDDLVTAGKVRYLGFSDTPAWKVAQAQTIAHFRGWAPVIALQAEYSLLERTAEGELIPMAEELGLGVMPWSPLRSGALTGKYTRDAVGSVNGRGAMVGMLDERAYTIIDDLIRLAGDLGTTPAAVALAWVRARPGISSTLIGARNIEQLDANVASLEIALDPQQIADLESLSIPALNFPAAVIAHATSGSHAGATVNGERSTASPFGPGRDGKIY